MKCLRQWSKPDTRGPVEKVTQLTDPCVLPTFYKKRLKRKGQSHPKTKIKMHVACNIISSEFRLTREYPK